MFIAIVGLAIWASALGDSDIPDDFLTAVDDVLWVCSTLLGEEDKDKDKDEDEEDEDEEENQRAQKKRRTSK